MTSEVGWALVKGHGGSSLSPEKKLELFRNLPRD